MASTSLQIVALAVVALMMMSHTSADTNTYLRRGNLLLQIDTPDRPDNLLILPNPGNIGTGTGTGTGTLNSPVPGLEPVMVVGDSTGIIVGGGTGTPAGSLEPSLGRVLVVGDNAGIIAGGGTGTPAGSLEPGLGRVLAVGDNTGIIGGGGAGTLTVPVSRVRAPIMTAGNVVGIPNAVALPGTVTVAQTNGAQIQCRVVRLPGGNTALVPLSGGINLGAARLARVSTLV